MRFAVLCYSLNPSLGAGAARATALQVEALRANGHEVLTLEADELRAGSSWKMDQPLGPVVAPYWNTLTNQIVSRRLHRALARFVPDCVVFNAVDRGVLSMVDISRLPFPILWFVRDSWAYTGGCLFRMDPVGLEMSKSVAPAYFSAITCEQHRTGCATCPVLKDSEKPIAAAQFHLKNYVYGRRPDIVFAGISPWVVNELKNAPLTQNHKIVHIPNWAPGPAGDKHGREGRTGSKVLKSKPYRVLVAAHSTSNPRKGFGLLLEAIKSSDWLNNHVEFVAIGGGTPELPFVGLGRLSPAQVEREMAAADLVCVPALHESLSMVAFEALLSGTPVVAFDTTGLRTLIEHEKTGFLAKAFDTSDLARGLIWSLEEENLRFLASNAERVTREKMGGQVQFANRVVEAAVAAKKAYGLLHSRQHGESRLLEFLEITEPIRILQYGERARLRRQDKHPAFARVRARYLDGTLDLKFLQRAHVGIQKVSRRATRLLFGLFWRRSRGTGAGFNRSE